MKEDDFGEDKVYSSPPPVKQMGKEETRVEVHGETYEMEEEMQEETRMPLMSAKPPLSNSRRRIDYKDSDSLYRTQKRSQRPEKTSLFEKLRKTAKNPISDYGISTPRDQKCNPSSSASSHRDFVAPPTQTPGELVIDFPTDEMKKINRPEKKKERQLSIVEIEVPDQAGSVNSMSKPVSPKEELVIKSKITSHVPSI